MNQQPYYFQVVPRTIISKTFDKQQGQFKFHVYKTTQQVDFSREPFVADFVERKMNIKNAKLNFFLPNYIAGKNTNAKFMFQLSKKLKYSDERSAGSYTIDPNIYIEQFKRNQVNHYTQLWQLSDSYSVEVELFFQESRYLLEKLLKQHRNNPATIFNKPLVSKALEQAKKIQIQEEQELQNEQRYQQKRLQLISKFSGSIVGQGGYRILNEEEQKLQKKQSEEKKLSKRSDEVNQQAHNSPVKNKSEELKKLPRNPNQRQKSVEQNPVIKRTESIVVDKQNEEFSQAQIKNLKYLILVIVILILAGSGYFMSKLFLKENSKHSVDDPQVVVSGKKGLHEKVKKSKSKSKGPKKPKTTVQQL